MKIKDLRKLKEGELVKRLNELKIELTKLAGQSATGTPPKSSGQIKQIKRAIAQIKTLQNESKAQKLMEENKLNA